MDWERRTWLAKRLCRATDTRRAKTSVIGPDFLNVIWARSQPASNSGDHTCHRTTDRVPERDLPSGTEHDDPILLSTNPYFKNKEICESCLRFGSAHSATWNAVFCDGSVHSLTYNIDLATHQALSSRAAGDSPDEKQY